MNILPRYPQKNFAARHKESLSQKVVGDCAGGLLYALQAVPRKKAHSFQMRVLVLPRKGSEARAWAGFFFIRSGLADSKKVPPFYLIDSFAATGKWSEGYSVLFVRGAPTSEDLSRITQ